jgi:hypothetical protein
LILVKKSIASRFFQWFVVQFLLSLKYGFQELENLWNQVDPLLTAEGCLALPIREELKRVYSALLVKDNEKCRQRLEQWKVELEHHGSWMERWGK